MKGLLGGCQREGRMTSEINVAGERPRRMEISGRRKLEEGAASALYPPTPPIPGQSTLRTPARGAKLAKNTGPCGDVACKGVSEIPLKVVIPHFSPLAARILKVILRPLKLKRPSDPLSRNPVSRTSDWQALGPRPKVRKDFPCSVFFFFAAVVSSLKM